MKNLFFLLCLVFCVACDATGPSDTEFSVHKMNNLVDVTVKTKTTRQGLEINLSVKNIAGFTLYPTSSAINIRVTDYADDLWNFDDNYFINHYWQNGLANNFSYAKTYTIENYYIPAEIHRGKVYITVNLTNYSGTYSQPLEIGVEFQFDN